MTIRYLGNKVSQSKFIVSKVMKINRIKESVVGDLFSGTGAISASLKRSGLRVHANDFLKQCELRAKTILMLSKNPAFDGLEELMRNVTPFTIIDSTYHRVLTYLNLIEGEKGFFYTEYSPEGSSLNSDWERMYFTSENAKHIDAIRMKIIQWKSDGLITNLEHSLLLTNLIEAVSRVANISGTYGCFLKRFEKNALDDLSLVPFSFTLGRCDHIVTSDDIFKSASETNADVVYLDPPYTKRQYITYYHIPETIALEDFPKLIGKTGIRPWKSKASVFCYKRKALTSLKQLVDILWPRKIFLSYSSDGHITKQEILDLLSGYGQVRIFEYNQRRFKSTTRIANISKLQEYLFQLEEGN